MKLMTAFVLLFALTMSACGKKNDGYGTHIATPEQLKAQDDKQRVAMLKEIFAIDVRTFTELNAEDEKNVESAALELKKNSTFELKLKLNGREPRSWSGKFIKNADSDRPALELEQMAQVQFLVPERTLNILCAHIVMKSELTGKSALLLCEK